MGCQTSPYIFIISLKKKGKQIEKKVFWKINKENHYPKIQKRKIIIIIIIIKESQFLH
jgi:hypothetical protein